MIPEVGRSNNVGINRVKSFKIFFSKTESPKGLGVFSLFGEIKKSFKIISNCLDVLYLSAKSRFNHLMQPGERCGSGTLVLYISKANIFELQFKYECMYLLGKL